MTAPGGFSERALTDGHVVKRLMPSHPAGVRFAAAMARGGAWRMLRYLDALRDAGVQLADDLVITAAHPLAVRHRWMEGPVLTQAAATAPEPFVDAVLVIAKWVGELAQCDARVDTNLTNFCLAAEGPVLVDVLPALIPSLCPEPVDSFDELFHALCFDTGVTLDALIGYALRTLIDASATDAARRLSAMYQRTTSPREREDFPHRWFRARVALASRAVNGDASVEVVSRFFAITSVRDFGRISEATRTQRIDQIDQLVDELGLR